MNDDWYLESFNHERRKVWRTAVSTLPFHIGRHPRSDLCLTSRKISQHHAEIRRQNGDLVVVDLGSTNGTYVNERRIRRQVLREGDAMRIADLEFCLVRLPESAQRSMSNTFTIPEITRTELYAERQRTRRFRHLLRERQIRMLFQPVVRLSDGSIYGYEALGRGDLNGDEISPRDLFAIAEPLGLAAQLSSIFRARGLADAAALPGDPVLFLNVHPDELADNELLIASLERPAGRPFRLAMEINETAVTDREQLIALRDGLAPLRSTIAFDDFGTGQARLFELTDVGPRYLKFDRAWLRGLHHAPDRRRRLISALIELVQDLGIVTVAEGIETPAEVEACKSLGFELAQGYFFGRPAPVEHFGPASSAVC